MCAADTAGRALVHCEADGSLFYLLSALQTPLEVRWSTASDRWGLFCPPCAADSRLSVAGAAAQDRPHRPSAGIGLVSLKRTELGRRRG